MARYRDEEEYYYEEPQQNVRTLYPMYGNYCPPINVATPINIAPPVASYPVSRRDDYDYEDKGYYDEPRRARREQRRVEYYGGSPVLRLSEHRGLLKMLFLGLITLGIYPFVTMYRMSVDINIIASRYDGRRTMNYAMLLMLILMTAGIGYLVWESKFCARIKNELARRGIDYRFGAGSFWGWNTLGCLILIGPLIFIHKRCKAMNLLSEHYNIYG